MIRSLSKETWVKLNKLSKLKLYELAKILRISFMNEPEDKEELVLIISATVDEECILVHAMSKL